MMLTQRKSLTFYQTTAVSPSLISLTDVNAGIFATSMHTQNLISVVASTDLSRVAISAAGNTIGSFNRQFDTLYQSLLEDRSNVQAEVVKRLSDHPSSDSMRSKGVELMWKYLKAEAQMGGNSSQLTPSQQAELLEKGKVRNFEGHHINSVGERPDLQANPDNVTPLEEHRIGDGARDHFDAHGRNWQNPTKGALIDRNKILRDTNDNRVSVKEAEIRASRKSILKNELSGLGAAIAIGFGMGFTIGFVITLAQSGVSSETFKNATIAGLKSGATASEVGGASYLLSRTIGQISTNALQGALTNAGVEVTKNIAKICSMGAVGLITITVFSVYQFFLLKRHGYATSHCLLRIGKQAVFSLSVLAVSIIAQGAWGGYAGLIVSTSVGMIVISCKIGETLHTKAISEKIHIHMIECCYPRLQGGI